jgi:hypothetical protein
VIGRCAAVAGAAAREGARAYAIAGAALGAAAVLAAWAAGAQDLGAEARARLAAGYAAGPIEALAAAAAALAVAFTLPRDIASGRAALVLVRPVPAGALLAGRLAGAVACAAAVVAAALVALGFGAALAGGGAALAGLAPRAEIAAARVEVPGPSGEPVAAAARFGLAAGSEAVWRFEGLRAGEAAALRIAPAYALRGDFSAPVKVRLAASGTRAGRAEGPIDLGAVSIPARRPAEAPLPPALSGCERIAVLVTVASPDALLGFGGAAGRVALVGRPAGLPGAAAAAAGGLLAEAAFVAALAVLGSTFLSAWPAALFAGGLGLAARFPDLLRAFRASATIGAAHAHGVPIEAPGPAAAQAIDWVQRAADALAAALPDLSRLDALSTLARGEAPETAALARAALLLVPHAIAAVALGAAILRFREPGRTRA